MFLEGRIETTNFKDSFDIVVSIRAGKSTRPYWTNEVLKNH